ncbi:MAG: tetratricopeptide repeat protein [Rhizomicrobium sp.]
MTRTASPFVLFFCASVLAGCAGDKSAALFGPQGHAKTVAAASDETPPADVESGVREARSDRLAGRYDEAIRVLSQLMLVAADDPRVVGEYGKTLAEKGRGQEAAQFLTRATELQPRDWSLYSALGVAYDELGRQDLADKAYVRALSLKPAEPSILNNYALSRLMAKDPATARQLMAEAERAGGASDPKIARNIALVKALAVPAQVEKAAAASDPLPQPAGQTANVLPAAAAVPAPQVVMEPIPADPLAGPVKPRPVKPRPAVPKAAPAVPQEKAARWQEPGEIPDLRDTASAF